MPTHTAPTFLPPDEPVDLDNCANEPIHVPGAVQAHGAVLVARTSDRVVVQLSANSASVTGHHPEALSGRTLDELFGPDAADRLTVAAERSGGPAVRPDRMVLLGAEVDTHAFTPAEGLIGVDVERPDGSVPGALEVIDRVSSWAGRLQAEQTIDGAMVVAASALRNLTGFDRAWAYRFADDGHGIIVAEDRREDLESFLGLHFPESDIPQQARDLYRRNGARVIGDTHAADAALRPVANPETGERLDLSASGLRAVSPIHIRYLRNMGVRSSMSVPVVVAGKLWGLLSAHTYESPVHVPIRVRAECEMLGALTSMQLATTAELSRARDSLLLMEWSSRVNDQLATSDAFAEGLTADPDALLGLCRATGAIVAIGGERATVGAVPDAAGVDRLLMVLASRPEDLIVSDRFPLEEPVLEGLANIASGVIAFPVSRSRGSWIIWLRGETVQQVTWGNRDKGLARRDPSGTLELGHRESFERWAEEVRGQSEPWTSTEVDAVEGLRASLGTLLIARTERLARLNEQLERSNAELDAFAYAAAHDLREPIRGIEQFSEFLREDFADVLGDDGCETLDTILRLSRRMEGLLTALLQYAEFGEQPWTRAPVALPDVVADVREMLATRIPDNASISVSDTTVDADPDGLRQLLMNLIWNAVKYSDEPARIEVGTDWLSQAEGARARVRRSMLDDREPVVVYVRDQGIGVPEEHHEEVFQLFRRLHGRDERGGGHGAGLTLARRIVERHGGAIWIDSAPGEGTTVYFTLQPA